jgi:hypothetical protein
VEALYPDARTSREPNDDFYVIDNYRGSGNRLLIRIMVSTDTVRGIVLRAPGSMGGCYE